MTWLRSIFNTPARQAVGWTVLGLLGIAMATGGVFFLTRDDSAPQHASVDAASPPASASATVQRTVTPTASPTPSPSPTATPTATPSPTTRPVVQANTGGSGGSGSSGNSGGEDVAPTPTPPPAVAGGPYCPGGGSNSPPNSVIGIFTIGGVPAPAGSAVSLAFDGVVGPTRLSTAAGGYRVDYFAGPESCANRVGAAISVLYDGQAFATGHTVGDSPGAPVNLTIAIP